MYARVLIDIAHTEIDRLFTYRIPEGMEAAPGMHVLAPFGRGNAPKEGFVIEVTDAADGPGPFKALLRALEPYPVLLGEQIELARWMQRSYNCLLVDALRLMIPAQMRGGRVHEKVTRTVALAPGLDVPAALKSLCAADGRPRAPKQYEVLSRLAGSGVEMAMSDLAVLVPGAAAAVAALARRGYVVEAGRVTFRRPPDAAVEPPAPPPALTGARLRRPWRAMAARFCCTA